MVLYSIWGGNRGIMAEKIMGIEEYGEVTWVLEVTQTHKGVKDVWHQSLEKKIIISSTYARNTYLLKRCKTLTVLAIAAFFLYRQGNKVTHLPLRPWGRWSGRSSPSTSLTDRQIKPHHTTQVALKILESHLTGQWDEYVQVKLPMSAKHSQLTKLSLTLDGSAVLSSHWSCVWGNEESRSHGDRREQKQRGVGRGLWD